MSAHYLSRFPPGAVVGTPRGVSDHVLSTDDTDGRDFLYTPDMGDAPHLDNDYGGFFSTKVHGKNRRTRLNNRFRFTPWPGPIHKFGISQRQPARNYTYEWIGTKDGSDVDGECEANTVDRDRFDDGVRFIPSPPRWGELVEICVDVKTAADATGHTHDYATYPLWVNVWLDLNTDGMWAEGGEHIIRASRNAPGPWTVCQEDILLPGPTGRTMWLRARLDWGEDVKPDGLGRPKNAAGFAGLSPLLELTEGAAQFGEVEDYPLRCAPPPDWHTTWRPGTLESPPVTVVDFSAGGLTIPADFFGPGSAPFSDLVPLRGLSLGSDLGDSSLCLQRPRDPELIDLGSVDTVGVEVVGLSLASIDPITVTFADGSGTCSNDPNRLCVSLADCGECGAGGQPCSSDVECETTDDCVPGTCVIPPLEEIGSCSNEEGRPCFVDSDCLSFCASSPTTVCIDNSDCIIPGACDFGACFPAAPEEWDLGVTLSDIEPPVGQITATKLHDNGGTFTGQFFIHPLLTFTRRLDNTVVHLDPATQPLPVPLGFNISGDFVESVNPSLGILVDPLAKWVSGVLEQDGVQQLVPLTAVTSDEPPTVIHVVCPPTPRDPHSTVGEGLTFVNFGSADIPPIPADFFEPGSPSFEGVVQFQSGSLGIDAADTLLQRSGPVVFPGTGFPRPSDPIQTEIVELSLTSVFPIDVGTSVWQIDLTLSESPSPAGQLQATLTHENGGTFDATIPVDSKFVFTSEAGIQRELLASVELAFFNVPFVINLGAELPNAVIAPSNGNFVPGIEELVPGDPSSQIEVQVSGVSPGVQHTIRPPTEPKPPPEFPPDPHSTVKDGLTFVTFGSPDIPPIPADFFSPGSDPFVGGIPLDGSGAGSVDTLVQRLDPLDFPGVGLPRPSEPIQTEIVELSLSGGPIVITENGGQNPQGWLVDLTLSDTPSPPGQLDATLQHENGGVFDHTLPVMPKFVFTSVNQLTDQRTLDFALFGFRPVVLNFPNVPFVIHLGQDLARVTRAPSNGNFVPGIQEVNPGDSSSQVVISTTGFSEGKGVVHTVIPAPRPPCTTDEECDDGRECTDDACDIAIGECFNTPLPAGTECGPPADSECEDPATCDEAGNCLDNFKPSGTPCNDGNTCTAEDRCDKEMCIGSDVSQFACIVNEDCPEPPPDESPYQCLTGFCVCGEVVATPPVLPGVIDGVDHDIKKNRFISVDPNNTTAVSLRVELLDQICSVTGIRCNTAADCKACVGGAANGDGCIINSDCPGGTCTVTGESCNPQSPPVLLGWASDPVQAGGDALPGTFTSEVVKPRPAPRIWTAPVIHIADCEIAPVRTYAISATTDGVVFSGRLVLATINKPQGKFWGDLVGNFNGVFWSRPNGLVGVDDVNAMIKFLSLKPAPHITVVDLVGGPPRYLNFDANATDLQMVLEAFTAGTWPPLAVTAVGYPANGDVTLCP